MSQDGIRGIRLESLMVGGTRCTSLEAMQRQVAGMENPLIEASSFTIGSRVAFRHDGRALDPIAGQFVMEYEPTGTLMESPKVRNIELSATAAEFFAKGVSLLYAVDTEHLLQQVLTKSRIAIQHGGQQLVKPRRRMAVDRGEMRGFLQMHRENGFQGVSRFEWMPARRQLVEFGEIALDEIRHAEHWQVGHHRLVHRLLDEFGGRAL